MGRKCTICGEEALFGVKDTSDFYCQECAEEHFDDLSCLRKVEDIDKEKQDMKKIQELEDADDAGDSSMDDEG